MRYIQAEEVKAIAFLLVAMLLYTFLYFIYDNRLLIRLYFGRKKSVVRMKGRGKEVIETRIRFVIQESPLDKRLYHLVEMNGQIYNLSKARVFGTIDYAPMRASSVSYTHLDVYKRQIYGWLYIDNKGARAKGNVYKTESYVRMKDNSDSDIMVSASDYVEDIDEDTIEDKDKIYHVSSCLLYTSRCV